MISCQHLVLLLKLIVELVVCDLVFLSLSNFSFASFFVLVPTKSFTSGLFNDLPTLSCISCCFCCAGLGRCFYNVTFNTFLQVAPFLSRM